MGLQNCTKLYVYNTNKNKIFDFNVYTQEYINRYTRNAKAYSKDKLTLKLQHLNI